MTGNTGSIDHSSPGWDILGKLQNTKALNWSTRIGLKWSGCPFFPLIRYAVFNEIDLTKINSDNLIEKVFGGLNALPDIDYFDNE